jgi:hypothetical protein
MYPCINSVQGTITGALVGRADGEADGTFEGLGDGTREGEGDGIRVGDEVEGTLSLSLLLSLSSFFCNSRETFVFVDIRPLLIWERYGAVFFVL